MSPLAQDLADKYMLQRASARVASARSAADTRLASTFQQSLEKAVSLEDMRHVMTFTSATPDLGQRLMVGVAARARSGSSSSWVCSR